MSEKRYRVMNHDDYELDYIADSQQGFKKVDLYDCCDLLNEYEQLKKENYELHKRLGDFEQFEEHIKERTSKTSVKKCVYFNSVLGVCDIDGSVNCPCENYEELVRMSEITKEKGDMMTEKRYTTMWKSETTFSRFWIVRENWERKLNANDVVDLLNEQHEQIERLKGNFRALEEVKCELADENEELKQRNEFLKKRCNEYWEEAGLNSDYYD